MISHRQDAAAYNNKNQKGIPQNGTAGNVRHLYELFFTYVQSL